MPSFLCSQLLFPQPALLKAGGNFVFSTAIPLIVYTFTVICFAVLALSEVGITKRTTNDKKKIMIKF